VTWLTSIGPIKKKKQILNHMQQPLSKNSSTECQMSVPKMASKPTEEENPIAKQEQKHQIMEKPKNPVTIHRVVIIGKNMEEKRKTHLHGEKAMALTPPLSLSLSLSLSLFCFVLGQPLFFLGCCEKM
jgi:hypothetical protein